MSNNPKWRIGVTISTHHIIEVEEPSAQMACNVALELANKDSEYYKTGFSSMVTSCLINDKDAREFSLYVPEFIERKESEKK